MTKRKIAISSLFLLLMIICLPVLASCGKKIALEDVGFKTSQIELFVGEKTEADLVFAPLDASNKEFLFSFSVDGIASMNGMTIEGVSPGSTILKITTLDGAHKANLVINVYDSKTNLSSPNNLYYDNTTGLLKWDNVDGALSYKVLISTASGTEEVEVSTNSYSKLKAGLNYYVSVKAVGDEVHLISSSYSYSIGIHKLLPVSEIQKGAVVNNVLMENRIIWNKDVESNALYEVYVNGGYVATTNNNYYDVEVANNVNYKVTIKSTPRISTLDGVIYYNSDFSSQVSFSKLTSPNLQISNGLISWDRVEKASSYNLKFTQENKEDIIINVTDSTNYNLNESKITGLTGGEYSVFVQAIADVSVSSTSDYGQSILFTKLATPSVYEIINNKYIISKVDNASSYKFYVSGVAIPEVNYTYDGDFVLFDLDSVALSYSVPMGAVALSSKAVSNDKNGINYVNSDNTTEANATILNSPTNLNLAISVSEEDASIRKNQISFSTVPNAYGYELKIDGGNSYNSLDDNAMFSIDNDVVTVTGIEFPANASLGYFGQTYIVRVRAMGASSSGSINLGELTILTSQSNLYISSGYSAGLNVIKNNTPSNLVLRGTTISWNNPIYNSGNIIVFEHSGNVIYKQLIVAGSNIDISPVAAGDVKIYLVALGDGINSVDSDLSIGFNTIRLSTPTGLICDLDKITWTSVTNAIGYQVLLNGELIKGNDNQAITFENNEFDMSEYPSGEYVISVFAIGSDNQIYSVRSEALSYEKLAKVVPVNNNGTISFDLINGASKYEVYLNNTLLQTLAGNQNTFTLPLTLPIGDNKVNIKAIGSESGSTNYISSDLSDDLIITKLASVTSVEINEGNLKFNYPLEYYNLGVKFIAHVNDGINTTDYNLTHTFTQRLNEVYVNAGNLTDLIKNAGTYNISIEVALLSDNREFSINSNVVNLENSFIILDKVETLSMANNILNIDNVLNAQEYLIKIVNPNNEITYITISDDTYNLYSAPAISLPGEYTITVKAIGNGTDILSAYLESPEIKVFKLPNITSYTISSDNNLITIDWDDGVIGETTLSYEAFLNGEKIDLFVGDTSSLSLDYTSYLAGSYNIEVLQKVNNSSYYISSDKIIIKDIIVLSSPTCAVGANLVSWQAVDGATVYSIKIIDTTTLNSAYNNDNYSSLSLDLSFLQAGTFNIEIMAVGNGEKILSSKKGGINNIQVLPIVNNIRIDSTTKLLEWDNILTANSYELIFDKYENGQKVVGKSKTVTTLTNSASFPSELENGEYRVKIKALGNRLSTLDSIDYSDYFTFSKNVNPTITHNNGVITVNRTSATESFRIIVKYNGTDDIKYIPSNDNSITYNFENAGTYYISAILEGDYLTTIDSNNSVSLTVIKLENVRGLTVENNKIKIDSNELVDENPNLIYLISLAGNTNYNYSYASGNEFDIDNVASGKYSISISIQSNQTITYLSSELYTIYNVYKLESPILLGDTTGGMLRWQMPLGYGNNIYTLTGFKLTISAGGTTITENLQANISSYDLSSFTGSGNVAISLFALGNNGFIIDSAASTSEAYQKLTKPVVSVEKTLDSEETGYEVSPYSLKWNSIIGAENYDVEIYNANIAYHYNVVDNYISLELLSDILSGTYTAKVRANSTNNYYFSGDYSDNVSFTKLSNEVGLSISQGAISWNRIDNAKCYILYLGGREVVVNENYYIAGDSVNAGTYDISIRAIAIDGGDFINSNKSENITATKLDTPNQPIADKGYVSFETVAYITNDSTYRYEISYGENTQIITSASKLAGTIEKIKLYSLEPNILSLIKIRALGDNSTYLNSNWSTFNKNESEFRRLIQTEAVTGFDINNELMTWTNSTGANRYDITINYTHKVGRANITDNYLVICTTNQYNFNYRSVLAYKDGVLDTYVLGAGTYNFMIEAYSDANYTYSTAVSLPSVVTVYDSPVVNNQNGILSWQTQNDATSTISIDGVDYIVNSSTHNLSGFAPKTYQISIKINGDNKYYITGETKDFTVYKLPKPYLNTDLTTSSEGMLSFTIDLSTDGTNVVYTDAEVNAIFNQIKQTKFDLFITNSGNNFVEVYENVLVSYDLLTLGTNYIIVLNYYFDMIPSGEYEIKLVQRGNNVSNNILSTQAVVISSDNSLGMNVIVRENAGNLYVDNNTIMFEQKIINYEDSTSYEKYELFGIEPNYININENSYDLYQLEPKTYNVYVRVKGDSTIYLTSNKTNTVSFTKMKAPAGLRVEGGKIKFNSVVGASSYLLEYKNETDTIYQNITIPYMDNTNIYVVNLPISFLDNIEYEFRITAIGNKTTYIDSHPSASIFATKLQQISTLSSEMGNITFNKIENASEYLLVVKSENEIITEITIKSQNITSKENYIRDGLHAYYLENIIYYELNNAFLAGNYSINVTPIGSTGNGTYNNYITGNVSNTISYVKLATVTNLSVDKGIIKWTSVVNASGYYLVVGNVIYETLINSLTTTLPDELSAGEYEISIIAVGQKSTANYLSSNKCAPIATNKSSSINSFKVVDGYLVFEQGDIGELRFTNFNFKVFINNTLTNEIELTLENVIIKNISNVNYYAIDLDIIKQYILLSSNNNYTFELYGYSDGNVKGNTGKLDNILIYSTPTGFNININENNIAIIKWDFVDISYSYILSINDIEYVVGSANREGNYYVYQLQDNAFINANTVNIKLKQLSSGITQTLNSYYTDLFTLQIPATPENLTFNEAKNRFEWDAIPNHNELTGVSYVVEYTLNNEVTKRTGTGMFYDNVWCFYPMEIGNYTELSVKTVVLNSIPSSKTAVTVSGSNLLFSSGNGSIENPYKIYNATQLDNISLYKFAHYILSSSSSLTITNHTPIGDSTLPFTGSFNGNNKTINILSIEETGQYYGLFGNVNAATISNLTVSATYNINSVVGQNYPVYAGAIVGRASGTSNINNCYSNGTITTLSGLNDKGAYVGGIVGYNDNSIISNCVNNLTLSNSLKKLVRFGGIAGFASGNISNSGNNADITNATITGGIIGVADSITIDNCFNLGNISAISYKSTIEENAYAGGLVGNVSSSNSVLTISRSYNYAQVLAVAETTTSSSTTAYAGGLVGRSAKATITKCFTFGSVSAVRGSVSKYVGAFVGAILSGKIVTVNTCVYGSEALKLSYSYSQISGTSTYVNSLNVLNTTGLASLNSEETVFKKIGNYEHIVLIYQN